MHEIAQHYAIAAALAASIRAMREVQRKRIEGQSDFWSWMAIQSANSASNQGAEAQNAACANMQGYGVNMLSGLGQSSSSRY